MDQTITRRPRRTRQQILDLLSEYENTDTTVIEFCKTRNISPTHFYKWKGRYKTNVSPGFAALNVVNSFEPAPLFAEVKGIKIYQAVAASYLNELLQ